MLQEQMRHYRFIILVLAILFLVFAGVASCLIPQFVVMEQISESYSESINTFEKGGGSKC